MNDYREFLRKAAACCCDDEVRLEAIRLGQQWDIEHGIKPWDADDGMPLDT